MQEKLTKHFPIICNRPRIPNMKNINCSSLPTRISSAFFLGKNIITRTMYINTSLAINASCFNLFNTA